MSKSCSHTNLCQNLGVSCIGCCGLSFGKKDDVLEGIKKNTIEYIESIKNKKSITEFRDRYPKLTHSGNYSLRKSGICRNLIFASALNKDFDLGELKEILKQENPRIVCAIHPDVTNDGIEHRKGHCDYNHFCKTASMFNFWSEEIKRKFLDFLNKKIKNKELDWYAYSKKMDDNEMLNEFYGTGGNLICSMNRTKKG